MKALEYRKEMNKHKLPKLNMRIVSRQNHIQAAEKNIKRLRTMTMRNPNLTVELVNEREKVEAITKELQVDRKQVRELTAEIIAFHK